MNIFDKINLAQCAARRAELYVSNGSRFKGEFQTVALWKSHAVYAGTGLNGEAYSFTLR